MDNFRPEEKHATLLIDEMAIKPGLQYDNSLASVIGRPTMSSSSGQSEELATHALAFMLAGVSSRWKQTVAYELTGNSFSAQGILTIIVDIIKRAHEIGVTVRAIITDMGPQNRSFWRLPNIVASRHSEIHNWITHPCNKSDRLYIMPDPVHIFKNVAASLTSGHKFYLAQDVVLKNCLPSNEISLEAVTKVFQLDSKDILKLCPRLKENVLNPPHFEKMNIALSVALLNHDVAAGILFHISAKNIEGKHQTIAWFLQIMHRWFKLMTSRHQQLALSYKYEEKYAEEISFLHDFMDIVRGIFVDDKCWKPFQTGLLLATQTALDIQKIYFKKENFQYIMLGLLTQDALENLFSVVRSRQPVPNARDFKCALRLVCLSQFECNIRHASYPISDHDHLLQYCDSINELEKTVDDDNEENIDLNLFNAFTCDEQLTDAVKAALYYLLGCMIFKVKKNYSTCDLYWSFISSSEDEYQEMHQRTILREYKTDHSLCYPSTQLFDYFHKCEIKFRANETLILNNTLSVPRPSTTTPRFTWCSRLS